MGEKGDASFTYVQVLCVSYFIYNTKLEEGTYRPLNKKTILTQSLTEENLKHSLEQSVTLIPTSICLFKNNQ